MIQQNRLFGLSLQPRRNRRMLVIGYYGVVLLLSLLPLYFGVEPTTTLSYLPQAVMIGAVLGGLMYGGLVKPYSSGMLNRDPEKLDPITLSMDGAALRRKERPLDERETKERDRAHFVAYRILLGLMVAMILLAWLCAEVWVPLALRVAPAMLWVTVASAFSLPQCAILWMEPDVASGEALALV